MLTNITFGYYNKEIIVAQILLFKKWYYGEYVIRKKKLLDFDAKQQQKKTVWSNYNVSTDKTIFWPTDP